MILCSVVELLVVKERREFNYITKVNQETMKEESKRRKEQKRTTKTTTKQETKWQ